VTGALLPACRAKKAAILSPAITLELVRLNLSTKCQSISTNLCLQLRLPWPYPNNSIVALKTRQKGRE
jgi:hypothetical protein